MRSRPKERAVLVKASRIAAQLADNHTIFYMDINWIFLRPDGSIPAELMPDFEHPSAKGYRLRAEAPSNHSGCTHGRQGYCSRRAIVGFPEEDAQFFGGSRVIWIINGTMGQRLVLAHPVYFYCCLRFPVITVH